MSEQKRERKLGEIFKRMIPLGILKEFFDEASDITVRLDRERRMMEVHCHLPKLYRKKDIYELEAAIAQTMSLRRSAFSRTTRRICSRTRICRRFSRRLPGSAW